MIKATQIEFGVQKRPYADHIYRWKVTADEGEDANQVAAYMRENIEECKNAMSRLKWYEEYRSGSFERMMEAVYAGRLEIEKKDNGTFEVKKIQPYID